MAVREAIFNALVHSDWSANNPVQIRVEDDRLFISNSCLLTEGWTAETFLSSHQSLLLNPNIANAFFRAGFIEAWGRGIEKMCTACRNYGSPEPVYITHPCDLMVRFDAAPSVMPFIEEERRKAEAARSVSEHQLEETTQKTTQKMIELMRSNPTITIESLCKECGLTRDGVNWNIRKLKSAGLIRRIGPDKGGHWEVVEENLRRTAVKQ